MANFKLEIHRGEDKCCVICHGLMGGGNVTQTQLKEAEGTNEAKPIRH